jgi:hypothetical protein
MSVISATQEVEIRMITVRDYYGQKVHTAPSQPIKYWVWWCTPVISAKPKV